MKRRPLLDVYEAHSMSARTGGHEFAGAYAAAARAFATHNGWHYSGSYCFHPEDLHQRTKAKGGYVVGAWFDHALFFKRDGINIAIIGQPYPARDGLLEAARKLIGFGCALRIPPNPYANLWSPGRCLMLVATHPDNTVNWLPEQSPDHDAPWRDGEPKDEDWIEELIDLAGTSELDAAASKGPKFKEWLNRALATDDPVGDFIGDAQRDYDFPDDITTADELEHYLHFRGACLDCLKVVPDIWKRYEDARRNGAFRASLQTNYRRY
jgi:uncharacterized protein YozE (UPF0346 family)